MYMLLCMKSLNVGPIHRWGKPCKYFWYLAGLTNSSRHPPRRRELLSLHLAAPATGWPPLVQAPNLTVTLTNILAALSLKVLLHPWRELSLIYVLG